MFEAMNEKRTDLKGFNMINKEIGKNNVFMCWENQGCGIVSGTTTFIFNHYGLVDTINITLRTESKIAMKWIRNNS